MPQSRPLHPITLTFRDSALEARYRDASLPALRRHSRIAILVGLALFALSGFLDHWFVPPEFIPNMVVIRLAAMAPTVLTFIYTFTPWFRWVNSIPLALIGAYASGGILFFLSLGHETGAMFYGSAMTVVTLFTYSFVGARFIHALTVNLSLLAAYNLIIGLTDSYQLPMMIGHDFLIVSANVIGAFDAYLGESHRRLLFLRELELDDQRRHHLERSLHDPLTGLPNRELLHDRLEQALGRATRSGRSGVAIYMDLDDFKPINDSYGHDAGDHVLKTIAQHMRSVVRESDTVARLGGDEFCIVASNVISPDDARIITTALADALTEPIALADGRHIGPLHASFGVCHFPYEHATPGDIIRRADLAMYSAKRSGSCPAEYDAASS